MKNGFKLTLTALLLGAAVTHVGAQSKNSPASIDELFGTAPAVPTPKPSPPVKPAPVVKSVDSKDALFGDTEALAPPPQAAANWNGFFQTELAYTYPSPAHTSKFLNKLELAAQGKFNPQVRWKLSGRASYNAVFDLNDFYPPAVRQDQRFEVLPLENYLDVSAGDFDFRLGRQHIIWGEVVGLFFADVVSAKDAREFYLPEFDQVRIPQWAARAEYFKNDFHAEVIWIPVMTYDKIGKPGAEFYPYPPPLPDGLAYTIENEQRPARKLENSAYGARLSYLKNGWDGSVFYYHSLDTAPTFSRTAVEPLGFVRPGPPVFEYRPIHTKIKQWGATLSKDLGGTIFRTEAVYTRDRQFNVARLSEPDGLVPLDTLDYIVGVDLPAPTDTRLNVQFFDRWFLDSDPDMYNKRHESGMSFYASRELRQNLKGEILMAHSLSRSDWLVRPKLAWRFAPNWRATLGADIFGGNAGFFGRFNNKDRVYTELRYDF